MPDATYSQESVRIAVLENQVNTLKGENAELKATLGKVFEKLDTLSTTVNNINSTLSEARGGWKMLMLVGGASATLGGAITAFAQHWRP